MSRIYNLKAVGSRTLASVAEGKPEAQLLSLKMRQREHHAQIHDSEGQQLQGQLPSQMSRIQLENQQLEMKLKQLCSQETREEPAAKQPVQKQLRPLQLKEQECKRTPHLTHCHQKIQQQDNEPHNQMAQPNDEEISAHTVQQRYNNQRTQPKLHQPNQSSSCTSFTIDPKPSHSTENPPKNPGRSLNVPAPSASSSISPSQSPSRPLFSLRSSAAVQSKRGTTITINPRKSGTGAASLTSPGLKGLCPSAPSPTPHVAKEKIIKRYATVEEIEVIGGYQILERSCLAKDSGTQKTVKVCFDEVQLEQVFEYPSEYSVLASFPSPPLSGSETGEGKEEEEDEDYEQKVLVRSSRTVIAGVGRTLRVDESCHQ